MSSEACFMTAHFIMAIYIYIFYSTETKSALPEKPNCALAKPKELATDLLKHGHVIGMYWENIARSMVERALFCLQAVEKAIDKQLTHQLLTVPNPRRAGKLQGMLLVHENMVARLMFWLHTSDWLKTRWQWW